MRGRRFSRCRKSRCEAGASARAAYRTALRLAARHLRVPVAQAGTGSARAASEARKLAAYLAVVVAAHSRRQVARAMRRDHVIVLRACEEIEERRDDPAFDALMERLERRYQARLRGGFC